MCGCVVTTSGRDANPLRILSWGRLQTAVRSHLAMHVPTAPTGLILLARHHESFELASNDRSPLADRYEQSAACATLCLLVLARLHRSFKHSSNSGTALAITGVTIVMARLARHEFDIRCIRAHSFCSSVRSLTSLLTDTLISPLSPCDQILQSFIHHITTRS